MSGNRTMTRAEMTVRAALAELPKTCRYHGENIEGRDLWRFAGACCATGQPSLMRRRAEAALTVLAAGPGGCCYTRQARAGDVSEETGRYRATCPRDGCDGLAWWNGRVADSGGGTAYRVWGCSKCSPERSSGRNDIDHMGVNTGPVTAWQKLWRRAG